jgi:acylphosphatase
MRREAEKHSVSGWVRNRSDGAVEAVVHGETGAVEAIVRWAHHGPPHAQVKNIEITPHEGSYSSFEIMR